MKIKKCIICHQPLDNKFGNNAEPVASGKCCNDCDQTVVIPKRISIYLNKTKKQ